MTLTRESAEAIEYICCGVAPNGLREFGPTDAHAQVPEHLKSIWLSSQYHGGAELGDTGRVKYQTTSRSGLWYFIKDKT